ncbi:hypothetical protein [Mucilaginibacter myungsuensis]|uniref:Uncharacterized protein n=1 Tax=Mucilaginibacter myungsuensis TaxID=649104 RepID=A0A929PWQ0_9SPHI|nr:hypothetical protein [Mucilaginibacter myungsuensis]MBE9661580.1 hypothetical protein [Mucilaginibacter myungsuensis]MDN3597723.1 hypothetical protein [Mucilaginibacter myungsuensis]
MGIFNKIFKQDNAGVKVQYFAEAEVALDGSEECNASLRTLCVEQAVAKTTELYLELTFKDNLLHSGRVINEEEEITEGDLWEYINIPGAIGKLSYLPLEPNLVYGFSTDRNGLHQFGGKAPDDLVVPNGQSAVSFQYLGFLSNSDKAFSWLPFTIHLVCPLYLNFELLYLDHSDPFHPVVINTEELARWDTSYNELDADSYIEYDVLRFSTKRKGLTEGGIGHTGIPVWIQNRVIPRCPKTNRTMRFLCQIGNEIDLPVVKSNVIINSDINRILFEKMNFWGDGDLYIFFEPEAKTVCYYIQHT